MAESKSERFHRIAAARTNKIITMLRLLGNCANSNNYEYSAEEVNQMFTAIESELTNAKKQYKIEAKKKTAFAFNVQR